MTTRKGRLFHLSVMPTVHNWIKHGTRGSNFVVGWLVGCLVVHSNLDGKPLQPQKPFLICTIKLGHHNGIKVNIVLPTTSLIYNGLLSIAIKWELPAKYSVTVQLSLTNLFDVYSCHLYVYQKLPSILILKGNLIFFKRSESWRPLLSEKKM